MVPVLTVAFKGSGIRDLHRGCHGCHGCRGSGTAFAVGQGAPQGVMKRAWRTSIRIVGEAGRLGSAETMSADNESLDAFLGFCSLHTILFPFPRAVMVGFFAQKRRLVGDGCHSSRSRCCLANTETLKLFSPLSRRKILLFCSTAYCFRTMSGDHGIAKLERE